MSKNTHLSLKVGEQASSLNPHTSIQMNYNHTNSEKRLIKFSFPVLPIADDFTLGELKGQIELMVNQAITAVLEDIAPLVTLEVTLENGVSGRNFCLAFTISGDLPFEDELMEDVLHPLRNSGIEQATLNLSLNDVLDSGADRWVGGEISFDSEFRLTEETKKIIKEHLPAQFAPLVLLNNVEIVLNSIEELKTVWQAFDELEEIELKYSMIIPLFKMSALDIIEDEGITREMCMEFKSPFGDLFDLIAANIKTISSVQIQFSGHELNIEATELSLLDLLPRTYNQILDFFCL
eukprot:TRINITY_DN5041_c0_g1_i1.p1 TRINITY_DN5041_c0_g1~~TRINITY_DN5041_c0_g1_i1.p1  ORF type:complete len:300 (-),score=63.37 TRINITY_DN5041_c0_g1_i1:30-908(-)